MKFWPEITLLGRPVYECTARGGGHKEALKTFCSFERREDYLYG